MAEFEMKRMKNPLTAYMGTNDEVGSTILYRVSGRQHTQKTKNKVPVTFVAFLL